MNILVAILIVVVIALVIALVFVCLNLAKVLKTTNETIQNVQQTVTVLTTDVDHLLIEAEHLLNKTNILVDDVNSKLVKTDPLFQAVGDVGISISSVNASANKFAKKFTLKKSYASGSSILRMSNSVRKMLRSKNKK